MNLTSMLFMSTLALGTVVSISSSSWIMMWVGLEVNLMSFIPLMKKTGNVYESEASMKYFLVQVMASSLLMFSILAAEMMKGNTMHSILLCSLFMKMGAAPFHFWYPGVMQGLDWSNCFILMTWQKIAPMIMMSYQLKMTIIVSSTVLMSVLMATVGGMGQTSIRKMMAYSSISHLGWLIMAMAASYYHWMMYFLIYSIVSLASVIIFWNYELYQLHQLFNMGSESNMKMTMFTSMLSMGGMPPFLGFIPKWVIIQTMIESKNYIMIMIMVMSTLITLFMYLRMTYGAFALSSDTTSWKSVATAKSSLFISTMITLSGMPLIATYVLL
uniref:NADH-ubiquinone oxidoreductase chain 2 n=1 Tax=Vestalis melania TaxID=1199063 RepID=V9ITF1_9ODON|nr:NADH dehydrogenase subunit 2 [Vestalis melania]AFM83573.1 NADH dehydrogenase subunit 2 [Vestalis melania]